MSKSKRISIPVRTQTPADAEAALNTYRELAERDQKRRAEELEQELARRAAGKAASA